MAFYEHTFIGKQDLSEKELELDIEKNLSRDLQGQLKENESTYVQIGVKHRLENASSKFLEIIEVQSGDYLGEDDIKRYDDIYNR